MGCFLDDLRVFGINTDWENGAERQNKGRSISRQNGSLQRNPGLGYDMQWYART